MAFDIQNYETFGLSEEEGGKGYRSFFIISFFTLILSAFLGFYFSERPLLLWNWDDLWFHFIPISISVVWTGIVFLLISPARKALDMLVSGAFGVFVWYKFFTELVSKKHFDFSFPVFSLQQVLQIVLGIVIFAVCALMLVGIFSFILLIRRKG